MRHFLLTVLGLSCVAGASAQLTAADAFTSAPASVFPLLDRNTRLDMVDYVKSGLSTPSANALKGSSTITAMSPGALSVRMTDSSTAQVIVLPAGSDSVIAVISTVAAPGLDSSISFYTTGWKPADGKKYFSKPDWKDWTVAGADVSEVTMQTPFMLASYVYDPDTGKLTLTNNLSRFLDKDVYDDISDSLHPELTYTWNGKKFTR